MSINQFAGLRKIRWLVESYQRPRTAFDPSGSWTHQYDLYIIAYSDFVNQGTIRISRKPNRNPLDVVTIRPTTEPGLKHYTQAVLECADNLLASPRRWTVSTKIAASETAEPFFNSGMTKEMTFRNGQVHVSVGGKKEKDPVPVAEPYGCKFCMLDAVQQLPVKDGFTIPEFGLFDEYDQFRPGYRLEFRQTAPIQLKGEITELSLFTMTGPGQIPASYWCDATGRLLFFVSGLEVYVLSEENGAAIDFYKKRDVFKKSAKLAKEDR